MTSNLGAEYLVNQPAGEDTEAVREEVMNVVRSHFRPEFLNRVDEIILFHRLARSEMGAIVEIQLGRLAKLLEDRKITLDLDEEAKIWLADKGYDPAYGARPLKRVIQKNVQDPLAELVLSGKIPRRRDGAGPAGPDGPDDRRRHGRRRAPAAERGSELSVSVFERAARRIRARRPFVIGLHQPECCPRSTASAGRDAPAPGQDRHLQREAPAATAAAGRR